ncbi:MAG: glycosyltransferase family 9 protein [Burkholderiales bacterium]|nr:glycosyltransferase family 9 protein [Burkholderiales bacterium]
MTVTPPRSVLVVCTRRIGDVLLVTPLVRSLARAWPEAAIDLLVFRGTEGIVAGNPDVRRVLTVPERPGRLEHLRFARALWRRWDLALSTLTGDRPTLYAWLAGRRCAGEWLDAPDQRWKRRLLDVAVPFDADATHTVAMHLALADALGVPRVADVVAGWTPADAQAIEALRARHALVPGGYAVVHPSPKFRYKQWTDAGWAALVRHLVTARGLRVALTGSPEADERALVARIASATASDAVVDLSGALSLSQTTALIAGAALYVGPDTVTTHAAAATGVPTVALFGPSDPVKWGPWPRGTAVPRSPWPRAGSGVRGNVALVQGEIHDGRHCVPCRLEGCERHVASASDCLVQLPVERVIAAVEAVMPVR